MVKLEEIPITTQRRWIKQGYCPWPRRKILNNTKNSAYGCWENMIQRCNNPNNPKYNLYGGRGIKVHPEFLHFEGFIKYIGKRPSLKHSIDRINFNGNYEPGNVRWATAKQQAKNSRCIRKTGTGIEKHGNLYRFKYEGKHQRYQTWEEAAEAKDNIYGKGNW